MIKNVLLRAPLLTNSGYGVHSRQIFEWLETRKDFKLESQALPWGATPWIVNTDAEEGLFGRIMNTTALTKEKYDVSFQVQLPDEWDINLARVNIGVTALVETDKCSIAWYENLDKMDHIVVPSVFTKEVVMNTFGKRFDRKVTVIPEWFNNNLNKGADLKGISDERYRFDTKFNLLTIGTITAADSNVDRKNLGASIAAAIQAFEGQKDVGIVAKVSCGKGTKEDRKRCIDSINHIVEKFRKSQYPKVHLVHGNMTSKEMAALYKTNSIKGYFSATRGEGYGLPLVDAAASGVPVVVTDWSGHLDFLGDSFLKVDYTLKEIPASRVDGRIFMEGTSWAEPDMLSFSQQLKDLKSNYEKHADTARKLRKTTLTRFSKQKICKKYDKFLRERFEI